MLQKMLLAELRKLRRRGRIAVRVLGFRGSVREILYDHEEDFFHDTAGSTRRKPGYELVTTTAHEGRWYPPAIAARVRCRDAVWGWLRPFQILDELNHNDRSLDGWAYIDRCVEALDYVERAAPAPDPKAVRAWRKRCRAEDRIEMQRIEAEVKRRCGIAA